MEVQIVTCLLLTVGQMMLSSLVLAQNTNFSYPYFSTPDDFLLVDDVEYYADDASFLLTSMAAALTTKSCGRLLYKNKVQMRDSTTGAVASFQTAFTFRITGAINWDAYMSGFIHGDGLAFTFAPNNSLLGQDPGSTLCLLKQADDGLASNRVFAVEFDTFQNNWCSDKTDSHIGVDINSMNSTWTHNLCAVGVRNCSYLCNGGYFTAWIDYDSAQQKLAVFFANGSLINKIPKPATPVIEANLSLVDPPPELIDDYMYVGFSASTGTRSEVHEIQTWQFATSGMPEFVPRKKVGLIAGVSAGIFAALLVLAMGFFVARYRKRNRKQSKFSLVDQNLVPRMFTHRELSKATKNFSRSELLGSGGFGAVYKGTLPSGALVAVKRMKHDGGEEGFQAEAASLSQIRHRNLLQLRGWCHEEDQLLLVYDYLCNGSLDEWLFQRRGAGKGINTNNAVEALPLSLRHSVLSGVAAALAYLHEECVQCVLHRDIKSSNVLLDRGLNAYLGDFGLARLIDHQKMEKTTMMAGTLGYMAPEMPHTGKATKETDVYSFGVLVLEVMCAVRPLDGGAIERGDGVLVERLWRAHEASNILQLVDPRLGTFLLSSAISVDAYGGYSSQEASNTLITNDMQPHALDAAIEEKKMITNLLHLGLWCCNPNPEDRPSMRLVSQWLQQASENSMEMSMPPLPNRKPQAHYSRPGFSQFAMNPMIPDSSDSGFSSVSTVEAVAAQESSSFGVSSGESAFNETSFVASSAIYSGR